MNANEIAFGIEFETTLPNSDTTPIGPYHDGYQVPWLPEGWKAERDSSIRTVSAGPQRMRIRQPEASRLRRPATGRSRRSTRSTPAERRVNADLRLPRNDRMERRRGRLGRLISLVGNHERAIFASTGTRRREQNDYSKKIKHYGNNDNAQAQLRSRSLPPLEPDAPGPRKEPDRIPGLRRNAQQDQGRRLPDDVPGIGRTRPEHANAARIGITRNAKGRKSCWDRPGAGEGETELNRLFYRLGWTKGWYKGDASRQGLRATRQRDHHAGLEGDQDEADRNGPQVRPGSLTMPHAEPRAHTPGVFSLLAFLAQFRHVRRSPVGPQ